MTIQPRVWGMSLTICALAAITAILLMANTAPSDDQLRALAEQTIPHPNARLVGQYFGQAEVRTIPSDNMKIVCGWVSASLETKPKFFYVLVSTWPWLRVKESYFEGGALPAHGAGMSYFCGQNGQKRGGEASRL